MIVKNSDVKFCGYSMPHSSQNICLMQTQMYSLNIILQHSISHSLREHLFHIPENSMMNLLLKRNAEQVFEIF